MTPLVMIHAAAATAAVPLGAWLLLGTKGTRAHRIGGRLWAALMLVAAGTSFGITGFNGAALSWLHLLSAIVIWNLGVAVWRVRRGDITGHRRAILGVYLGLIGAGIWAFLPFRTMGALVWG